MQGAGVTPPSPHPERKMHRVLVTLVAACSLAYVTPAQAQRARYRYVEPSAEFGVDAAVTFQLDPSATIFSIPVAQLRAGFFASRRFEVEPFFGLFSSSGEGERLTEVQFGVGALYHFRTLRYETQPYVRGFSELVSISGSNRSTSTSPALGIGFGAKFPFGRAFAFRPELNYSHVWTDGPADDNDNIQLLVGVSVFTP